MVDQGKGKKVDLRTLIDGGIAKEELLRLAATLKCYENHSARYPWPQSSIFNLFDLI